MNIPDYSVQQISVDSVQRIPEHSVQLFQVYFLLKIDFGWITVGLLRLTFRHKVYN